jgi:hypothetical protein
MLFLIVKYLVTAALVVAISELAKRSDQAGALLASLPIMTLLVLVWLHVEQQPTAKIANHAYYTFWYVIPTLPMFLAFPWLLQRLGFWAAMLASVVITLLCFALFGLILKRFQIDLL